MMLCSRRHTAAREGTKKEREKCIKRMHICDWITSYKFCAYLVVLDLLVLLSWLFVFEKIGLLAVLRLMKMRKRA